MTKQLSSRQQVARYLGEIVGPGGTFTMTDVRVAIPHVNQIDRRMRELREIGWRIDTYRTDPNLSPEELRVTVIGDRIWEPGAPQRAAKTISSATRRLVLDRDGNRCQVCGIQQGEEYVEYPGSKARMTVGHWVPKSRGGDPYDVNNMRTECSRCNEPARHLTPSAVDVALLKARIENLARKDKSTLARWSATGKREWSEVDLLWAQMMQLPAPLRDDIGRSLAPFI